MLSADQPTPDVKALAALIESIEIATDEHGDGATLMPGPARRLAAVLEPLIREREAKAWDESAQAVAWCLDNGEPSPAAALAYTVENSPYRAATHRQAQP